MDRHCEHCGKPLTRKKKENPERWRTRVTCGGRCAVELRKRTVETKKRAYYRGLFPTDAEMIAHPDRTWREWAKLLKCSHQTFSAAMKKRGWTRTGGNDSRLMKDGVDVKYVKPTAKPVEEAPTERQTWTDPAGNTHTLPASIALREEYKASIKRRIKRGEGVAMIGNVRVYEGPVTKAAA